MANNEAQGAGVESAKNTSHTNEKLPTWGLGEDRDEHVRVTPSRRLEGEEVGA